jgi:hypothetical protein
MAKQNRHKFYIYDSLYRAWVTLIVNVSNEKAEKMINSRYVDCLPVGLDVSHNACIIYMKSRHDPDLVVGHVIWIKNFDWSVEAQGTLAHELFHLVMYLLHSRGVSWSPSSDEAFAYYYGWWLRKMLNCLKPYYRD